VSAVGWGTKRMKRTLCRNKISFAMLAGGPVSRNGLPWGVCEMEPVQQSEQRDVREATSARPAS
jgi:hypothetical protein